MPVKIASLELENVKRIKAVSLSPTQDGLTVIGGRNAQGKTSVIDAIAWALGGERLRPANAAREGSVAPPKLSIELSNGLIVKRSGEKGTLKVIDPEGKKSGQTLLNSFIDELALNLPKFMDATDKEKAEILLGVLGVKDELIAFDRQLEQLENERKPLRTDYLGRYKVADDMPFYADVPEEPITATELIQEQQAILARNGENHRKRAQVAELEHSLATQEEKIANATARIADLEEQLQAAQQRMRDLTHEKSNIEENLATAKKSAEQLQDESTAEIEAKLLEIDTINQKVRENQKRAELIASADLVKENYQAYSEQINEVRASRMKLLEGVKMPLDGLSVEDGKLKYKGAVWSDMSSAEQLCVATAIVRSLKPECGFVLVDKLEQMDTETLAEFGKWAEAQGLQVIGTRVSSGDECSVIIEDGQVKEDRTSSPPDPVTPAPSFQPGVF